MRDEGKVRERARERALRVAEREKVMKTRNARKAKGSRKGGELEIGDSDEDGDDSSESGSDGLSTDTNADLDGKEIEKDMEKLEEECEEGTVEILVLDNYSHMARNLFASGSGKTETASCTFPLSLVPFISYTSPNSKITPYSYFPAH